jgi:putative transposase
MNALPRNDMSVDAFLAKDKCPSALAEWLAERWVGSCRREMLDHVIPLHEQHLRRLVRDYVNYYHQDRIHDSLDKDSPDRRPMEQRPSAIATATSSPRLGGLHHRYRWRAAA